MNLREAIDRIDSYSEVLKQAPELLALTAYVANQVAQLASSSNVELVARGMARASGMTADDAWEAYRIPATRLLEDLRRRILE